MNVLFITANRLGDAILSTGLADYIHRTWPQARITVVCGGLPATLFEGMPGLAKIIVLKKKSWNRHWIGLWARTVLRRWDLVVDLRDSAVSRLIPARKRFIFGRHIDPALHKVEQNAAVMKLADIPSPALWPTAAQKARAAQLIPDGGPVLAVGPTANWAGKTWPADRFIALISALTGPAGILSGARVAVLAAPGEEEAARLVLNSIPDGRGIDLIAKTDPGTAGAALARCALYIGNDSGLMHCAAAAGTPTFGLFGPSWPQLYRPWGPHASYASTPETFAELVDFEGYDPATVGTLMNSLSVGAVLDRVRAFWTEQTALRQAG